MLGQTELISLAALARLSLKEAEQATLIRDLDAILDYVSQLKVATLGEGGRPSPPGISKLNLGELKENILREDSKLSPRAASRRFKVKAIFSD